MNTRIISALIGDAGHIAAIKEAADLLRAGGIVAFPTEPVYGLGANALDANAVAGIFKAKGRPSSNPLIVHVENAEQAKLLVEEWPPETELLTQALWPGPLTIVLKKITGVPDIVTAGGDTVALRCPDHPVALALLRACGFPLAAPSANRSNELSPTSAAHVLRGLQGRIPLILDGGSCQAGIESTVLSLVGAGPVILRPGIISADLLSEVLGEKVKVAAALTPETGQPLLSPGQLVTHYAPRTPLLLAEAAEVNAAMESSAGKSVALLAYSPEWHKLVSAGVAVYSMPASPADYARELYAVLHLVDNNGHEQVVCEMPPHCPQWAGVRDRLTRAGSKFR